MNATARLPSLDGLRALAIVSVLFGHLRGTDWFPFESKAVGEGIAHLGVIIFFVISGFLITTLLRAEYQESGRISLRNFYVRRAYRIMPAFLVFVLAMLIAARLGMVGFSGRELLAALTWTVNYYLHRGWTITHFWSLSVEEQFYLLWPLALTLLGMARGLRLAVLMFVLGPVTRLFMRVLLPHSPLRDLEVFPAVGDGIAMGCMLALLREQLCANRLWQAATRPALAPLLLAVAVFVELLRGYTIVDALLGPLQLLCLGIVVEGSTRYVGRAHRLLNNAPVAWLGTLSYSLYLWQQPFMNRSAHAAVNGFPLSLACALLCACASFYLIERPMLRVRQAFRARTSRPPRAPLVVDGQSA